MIPYACAPSWKKIALLAGGILCILGTSFVSLDLDLGGISFIPFDKAAIFNMMHLPLFILIAVLWLQIMQVYRLPTWQKALSAFCFSFFVGIMYEGVQILNPGRSPSLEDIGINTAASLIGIVLYLALERSKPNLLKKIVCETGS
jgi:hypothetical protein